MKKQRQISSVEEMIELGQRLAAEGYEGFLLYGDLGAGKTHLVK